MYRYPKSHLVLLACRLLLSIVCLSTLPVHADQIVLLTDGQGRKVYVNTGEPTAQPVEWVTRGFRPSRTASYATPSAEIDELVHHTANRFQVDPQLVHAIIKVESEYNPRAVSPKGAMGLMQLVPGTAQRFGVANPFDPKQNLEGGVTYQRYLLNLFGGDLALSLAAYNAGENAVLRRGGIPWIAETQNYVRKVTELYSPHTPVPPANQQKPSEPYKAPIYRFVDQYGVVHFTNVE
jgi:soluble lytic murein transglycosylase-like protein